MWCDPSFFFFSFPFSFWSFGCISFPQIFESVGANTDVNVSRNNYALTTSVFLDYGQPVALIWSKRGRIMNIATNGLDALKEAAKNRKQINMSTSVIQFRAFSVLLTFLWFSRANICQLVTEARTLFLDPTFQKHPHLTQCPWRLSMHQPQFTLLPSSRPCWQWSALTISDMTCLRKIKALCKK